MAWATANIMNASGNMKHPMNAGKLLGEKMINSLAQFRAEMDRRAKSRQARYEAELEDVLDG